MQTQLRKPPSSFLLKRLQKSLLQLKRRVKQNNRRRTLLVILGKVRKIKMMQINLKKKMKTVKSLPSSSKLTSSRNASFSKPSNRSNRNGLNR